MAVSLTDNEKKALQRFKEKLLDKLGSQIISIKLFGSKARGDAHPESDIDILIIVKDNNRKNTDGIIDTEWDVLEEFNFDVYLSPISYSKEEFEYANKLQTNFSLNIAEDSVEIYAA